MQVYNKSMKTYIAFFIVIVVLLASISIVFAVNIISNFATSNKCELGYKNGPFFQQNGAIDDSDKGYFPCKSGTVTTNNGDFPDSCWGSSDTLTEYFIKAGNVFSYDVDCKNGCEINQSTNEAYCK